MGFLSKLVGAASAWLDEKRAEKQLKERHIPIFVNSWGLPLSEAQKTFATFLQEMKQEAEAAGTTNLPINYEDILLQKEATDPRTQNFLASARQEGARDEDIREWWNQHDLGRRMMLKCDEYFRTIATINWLGKNHPDLGKIYAKDREAYERIMDQAAAQIRKTFVFYGEPRDTKIVQGDDRPLPPELKFRVNDYIGRRNYGTTSDPDQYRQDCEQSTSFNALLRREIRQGRL
jgi:hypothetical protein